MESLSRINPVDIEDEIKKSFISYAMAVNISRALPDVRDGLKPVHRRILYSMHELGLTADKPYRKCARIVGDVLGKYHPHGDTAVYDSLVRMAQDFSIRYTLVDGHGNFGSVDGDSAAAMRYTEAKMAKITAELLRDLDKETVDMYPNFDESEMQPTVLPSRFPNLLVNGSDGIAVGMATNIPPHNLGEAIDSVVALIDRPDITVDELMDCISGPDFPTGGTIMGISGIRSAYRTGRGKLIVRAKAEIEEFNNNRSRIIVTELPYQVNKARLVEKIADLHKEKKLEGISDLRDESDRSGMRIVIEIKRDVNPNIVLNFLYKHTQMQESFGIIQLALVNGEPKVLNLLEILQEYLKHQEEVVTRRTQYDLAKARERAHILEGLIIALDNIDEVVALIRASANTEEARNGLMERFGLSERQAKAILEMRLQRLTGLEREKIELEYSELLKMIEYYISILNDRSILLGIIRTEILEIRNKYADARRTEIVADADDIELEDLIDPEDMAVTLTHFGYVKRLPVDTYRAQKRGGKGVSALSVREEDYVEQLLIANTHTPLLFFSNKGKVYEMKCYQLPEAGRAAKGTAIINILNLEPGEKINALIPVQQKQDGHLVFITKRGLIKRTDICEYENIRKTGKIAIGLNDDDELINVVLTSDTDELIIGTRQGKAIRFRETDARSMGRLARGVIGIDLNDDDSVVNMAVASPECQVMTITELGYGKRTDLEEYRLQSRGGKGIITHDLTDRTGEMIDLRMVSGSEDVMLISEDGTIIRVPLTEVRVMGRSTQGVRVMRVAEDVRVVAVTAVDREEEPEAPCAPEGEV